MEQSEGEMSLKKPVTPLGIDPGTVRLVAQRLKHYATPGPCQRTITLIINAVENHTHYTDVPVVLQFLGSLNNVS